MEYSVLMSVYNRENPRYFQESIQSMLHQTAPFSEFVLVCDGPLGEELEGVISWAEQQMGERLRCVRLPENGGLGNALRIGVRECRCEIIARMDSDDISRPQRCEHQLGKLMEGGYDIVGGSLMEFSKRPQDGDKCRVLPETSEEILQFAKQRNPFNHPCVMYRRQAVLDAGNYMDFEGFEDYYLWVRMLRAGSRGYNLPEVVLDMRTGNGMYARRGGRRYVASVLRFQKFLRDEGMISLPQFLENCLVRAVVGMIPGGVRERFYGLFLRK